MSIEEYFATGPPFERPIFDAVIAHLRTLGPVHVEPVSVGIFLKRAQSFCQLRPMTRWTAMSFSLDHRVQHPTIVRKPQEWSGRWWHVANLRSANDVDDRLRDLLTEAYLAAPPAD
jgi:hypothetical protein